MARFEAVLTSTKHPPGPTDTWLGETIVHAEDIRRPLGIEHHYPTEAVVRVANFYKGSNLLIGSKKRIEGLTLSAADTEWSHGTGPEVAGPDPFSGHGHDRAQTAARRPHRRRRSHAALPLLAAASPAPSGAARAGPGSGPAEQRHEDVGQRADAGRVDHRADADRAAEQPADQPAP